MLRCFLYLSVIVVASSHGTKNQIHKSMTPEEFRKVFGSDHENVPEYERVQAAHATHVKSPDGSIHRILHLKNVNLDIKLYLEPIEGILVGKHTPVWTAQGDKASSLGVKYTRIKNAMDDGVYFYQDPYNLAAVSSTYDEHGEALFEGTVGDGLVIRPLPKRFHKKLSRSKRSASDDYFAFSNRTVTHPNLRRTYDHVVYKNKEVDLSGIREKLQKDISEEKLTRHKRSYVEPPKTAHPQVLVIIDYSHYLSLQTLAEVKRYVISFWNAVDLRYRVFSEPQIRLNIAGIIISTDRDGVPYIQNHRTRPVDGPIVDADEALEDMARYFYNEYKDPKAQRFILEKHFDLIMTMTQLNLCNRDADMRYEFDCTMLGYAFRNGACTLSEKQERVPAVGIVEDNGGYIGILPAAHEVGHLLGARHDGGESRDVTQCPTGEGYLMSGQFQIHEKAFKWSLCSFQDFYDFFHDVRSECTFDKPKEHRPVSRILPGTIYSLDEQCDRIEGTRACNKNPTVCGELKCIIPNAGGQCRSRAPAAEGSDCGHRLHCINGKCIPKNATTVDLTPFPYDDYENS